MTLWLIVIIASLSCLALKLAGHLVPASWFEKATPARIANLLTVALLAALIAVQTLASGSRIVFDARIPALAVAAVLLALRAPFILVVVAAAVTAALIRAAS